MKRTIQVVRQSALDWTIVGCFRLTNGDPTGEVNYGGEGMGFQITRADKPSKIHRLTISDQSLQKPPQSATMYFC